MTAVKAERVTFGSEGVELAGEFRCADPGRKRPGVVLTGPFTGVKEQVVGTYASLLAGRVSPRSPLTIAVSARAAAGPGTKTARGSWPT
jgi:hypothetical protein